MVRLLAGDASLRAFDAFGLPGVGVKRCFGVMEGEIGGMRGILRAVEGLWGVFLEVKGVVEGLRIDVKPFRGRDL